MIPKVSNMRSDRSGKAVPNQYIITTKKGEYFQSYDTTIAFMPRDYPPKLFLNLGYYNSYPSVTTLKYLNKFLGLNSKQIREGIESGEIQPL